jgi:phosphatidylserine/phosphatidylglycerophosphate/cardiolipin synthase-like enzyme
VNVIIQPGDGIELLLSGIKSAKKSIEIAIFRIDQRELEVALEEAVVRGVAVQALIAYTNREGEKRLRKLELRLLAAGVTVSRTADDLVRYHDKFMIIDRSTLYLMAFNLTHADINRSRSFGVVTKARHFVQEAVKLFEADTARQPYTAGLDSFIVSPVNARKQLVDFLSGARKQLLIYDNQLADMQMIRLLRSRAKAGVEIKIIGRVGKRGVGLDARKLQGMRLHTRTIIRDGRQAFIGSQSLRKQELDARREVGIIFRDSKAVKRLLTTFEVDWAASELVRNRPAKDGELTSPAVFIKRAVKEAVIEVVEEMKTEVEEIVSETEEVKEAVKEAVREAIKDAVQKTDSDE